MIRSSILLLTKNGTSDLEQLLPSLFAQQDASPFEVIAVDSGSTDRTLDLLRGYNVRIVEIPPERFHHARTRNFAAGLARGEILVFLSQDAIPASTTWLSGLTEPFLDPGVGAAYGRQSAKPEASSERREALDTVYGPHRIIKDPRASGAKGYRFYHFSDANSAIRRSVWETARFPEDLMVFEDLGIAKRILDQGWKIVYEPSAQVIHSHTHTTAGLFKRYFDIGYTLKLLNIWDAPGTKGSLLADLRKMVGNKLRRSGRTKGSRSTVRALQQDAAKSIGLFLGLNQTYLPLKLKRRLSAFRVFG